MSRGSARTNPEDVGNRPRGRVAVVLQERSFVAAEHLQLYASGMYIELRFRAALQMLRGYQPDIANGRNECTSFVQAEGKRASRVR